MSRTLGDKALQTAVYTALSGGLSYSVYDYVPEGTKFPYIVLSAGFSSDAPDITEKSNYGRDIALQIDVFSREDGYNQVKTIAESISALLDRSSFTVTGFNLVNLQLDAEYSTGDDGLTRRAQLNLTVTMAQT